MTYRISYSISGSVDVDAKSPEVAVEVMRANMSCEVLESLDLDTLEIDGIEIDRYDIDRQEEV